MARLLRVSLKYRCTGKLLLITLSLAMLSINILHNIHSGWTHDFQTFYLAGQAIDQHRSPYLVTGGNTYGPYLNGPGFAVLFSILGFLNATAALAVYQIFCFGIIISSVFVLMRKLAKRSDLETFSLILVLFLSYPVLRDALGLAQVSTIIVGCFVSLLAIYPRNLTLGNSFAAACFIGVICELKPYIGLPILLIALLERKYRLLIWFAVQQLLIIIMCSSWVRSDVLPQWVQSMVGRTTWSSTDLTSWSSILSRMGIPHLGTLLLNIILISSILLAFIATALRKEVASLDKLTLSGSIGTLISTFVHPYDYVLLLVPYLNLLLATKVRFRTKVLCTSFITAIGPLISAPSKHLLVSQFIYVSCVWLSLHFTLKTTIKKTILGTILTYSTGTTSLVIIRMLLPAQTAIWWGQLELALMNLVLTISYLQFVNMGLSPRRSHRKTKNAATLNT